ncbi:hypothetical protein LCGC14_0437100 [marine sediment metagenome]|uniref:Uncharacterized protein n=1 Tax=marine sediment metagenome TaxID=412755 RepID=A0A0F9SSJ9_9ZZZZ
MDKNKIQNYLDKKFPELKLMVQLSIDRPRKYVVGLKTDVRVSIHLISEFDDRVKHELLYCLEDMLYLKLGLLNKAIDDIRNTRRELT